MSAPIVYIDRSVIRPGALEELTSGIEDLVEFIEAREPQLLYYGFHLDRENSRMTVVSVHPDSASLELHLEVGAAKFRELGGFIDLQGIEVFGEPSEVVLEQLRAKARDLGDSGSVVIRPRDVGFARFQPTSPG